MACRTAGKNRPHTADTDTDSLARAKMSLHQTHLHRAGSHTGEVLRGITTTEGVLGPSLQLLFTSHFITCIMNAKMDGCWSETKRMSDVVVVKLYCLDKSASCLYFLIFGDTGPSERTPEGIRATHGTM